jgi:hypothetical protein
MIYYLQLTALAAVAVAEPGHYGYGGHYSGYGNGGYGYGGYGYGGQLNWPSVRAPGFSSTCYGCHRGKRSADPEPEPHGYYGLGHAYGHGLVGHAYVPHPYAYGPAVAGHPTGTSYTHRSVQVKNSAV